MSEMVSLAEAARRAHVHYRTVHYWVKTGRLPITYERSAAAQRNNPNPKLKLGGKVRMTDVKNCLFRERKEALRREHSDLNLLTIPQLSSMLLHSSDWCYNIVEKFQLKKYYIDGVAYMVSGVELYEKAADDPYYAQLFLHL